MPLSDADRIRIAAMWKRFADQLRQYPYEDQVKIIQEIRESSDRELGPDFADRLIDEMEKLPL